MGGVVLGVIATVVLVISLLLPDSTPPPPVSAQTQATAAPVQAVGIRAQLAGELRRLRESNGLSTANAGRRAGIAQARVSRIENGTVRPTARDVDALCEAYELTPEDRNRLMYLQYELDR